MFTQSINEVLYISVSVATRLKNVIHQIDSKNGWLFFSARFTTKFRFVFVFTHWKMLFLRGFIFKSTEGT